MTSPPQVREPGWYWVRERNNELTIGQLEARAPSRTGTWPIDIEKLVQWALAQTGYLPWRNPTDDDLALDHGWTVIPKATRGLFRASGGVALKVSGGMPYDAILVVEAIKALPAATAAQVIACGKEGIRPDCMLGVEPVRVDKKISWRKKKGRKKGHRSTIIKVWWPCEPEAICAARDAYQRWHAALTDLAKTLDGMLSYWRITGFLAPAKPWERASENPVDMGQTPLTLPTRASPASIPEPAI